jgi:hypothetical protein
VLKYCREGMPLERRQKVLDHISADSLRLIESMKSNDWYPMDPLAEITGAIIAANEGNPAMAEHDIIELGKFIGREATNTFLRLIIRVLTPRLFAKKLQAIYLRYYSVGSLSVDVTEDRMVISFTGTKGFPHLPAIVVGWLSGVFEIMGKQLVSYKTTSWSITNPYNESFDVELVWKT